MKTAKVLTSIVMFMCICTAEAQNAATDANAVRGARPAAMERVVLGEPNLVGNLSVEEVISQYKKTAAFSGLALEAPQLQQLAWAGQSVIAGIDKQSAKENIALPMSLYFCMQSGVYQYNPAANSLDNISPADVRNTLAGAAHIETAIQDAPCTIVIAGSINSSGTVTREQIRSVMLLDAGRIAQNIELQAQSLGLGTLGVSSFEIGRVKRVIKLPQQQEPAYLVAVGRPAGYTPTKPANKQLQVLMITPGSERSDDVFSVKDVLLAAKMKVSVAQVGQNRIRVEQWQRIIRPDVDIQNVAVNDYNGVIVIGGVGDPAFLRNPTMLNIIQTAVRQGKVVGALGDAGQVLANAGVLSGVHVTGDQRMLQNSGGIFTGNLVESDQGIVTSLNQQAGYFARTFVATIKGTPLQQPQPQPPTQAIPPTTPSPMRTGKY